MWLVAAALAAVLVTLALVTGAEGPAALVVPALAIVSAFVVLAWALVRSRRQRRRYEEQLTAWAAERAGQTERLRIARDLHDLVSHGLGLVTVRAAAANRVAGVGGDAERAAALADIERVARETTTELRRLLTVLRTSGDGPAPVLPAASLGDLPGIVGAARDSGLPAALDLAELGTVSSGVQLAVCAVVREGLHNTARHAGPTDVRVRVHRDGDAVVASVRDGGPVAGWCPQPGAGHGLTGLRERVDALGGSLHAGPVGPGFHLVARLPEPGAAG